MLNYLQQKLFFPCGYSGIFVYYMSFYNPQKNVLFPLESLGVWDQFYSE